MSIEQIENLDLAIDSLIEQISTVDKRQEDNRTRISEIKNKQAKLAASVTAQPVEYLTDKWLDEIEQNEAKCARDLQRADKIERSLKSAKANLTSQLELEKSQLKELQRQEHVDKISKLAEVHNKKLAEYSESCEEINAALSESLKTFNYPKTRLYTYAHFSNRHRSLQKIRYQESDRQFYLEVVS